MDDALPGMTAAGRSTVGGLIHTSPFAVRVRGKFKFFIVVGEGPVGSAKKFSFGGRSCRVVFPVVHVGNRNHARGVDKDDAVDDVADFWRKLKEREEGAVAF